MLIYKHSDGYTGHVEAIQKILYAMLHGGVNMMRIFKFLYSLSHGWNNISVTISNFRQSLHKSLKKIKT